MKILRHNQIKKLSNVAQPSDLEYIKSQQKEMTELCFKPFGLNSNGAMALAHCQVEKRKPLSFFVTRNGQAIVNPVIVKENQPYMHSESCMSFPKRGPVKVRRFNMIFVDYILIDSEGRINQIENQRISGKFACVLQHEIDHFCNKYIYNEH